MSCIIPLIYKRRKPQDTVLYQVVQKTFLVWSGNYSLRHDEVLPKLPLRQWVLSVPKWLRYHLTKDTPLASQVLRIFIDEIEKQLKKSCDEITEDAKLGAVSFIQRFGSRLNLHIHFHCIVLDGGAGWCVLF